MYVKKLKRKCDVRGCRCTESFAISLTREMGNSVIICKGCLSDGLKSAENIGTAESNTTKEKSSGIPPLFFNAEALGLKKEIEASINDEQFKCTQCGKVYKTQQGLEKHMETHKTEE